MTRQVSQREVGSRPEFRANVAAGARASWQDPHIRQRRIDGQRSALAKRAPNPGREARLAWIVSTLAAGGFVNRRVLMKQFGISRTVACIDIRRFKAQNPGAMVYDWKRKAFCSGCSTVSTKMVSRRLND